MGEQGEIRRFAEAGERTKKTIRYFLYGSVIINVIDVLYMFRDKGVITSVTMVPVYIAVVLMVLSAVFTAVLAYTDRLDKERCKGIPVMLQVIIYCIANICTSDIAVQAVVYTLIFTTLLYNEKKLVIFFASAATLSSLVKMALCIGKSSILECTGMFVVAAIFAFGAIVISVLNEKYNNDMNGALQDERDESHKVLADVLRIAEVVQQGSLEVDDIIGKDRKSVV